MLRQSIVSLIILSMLMGLQPANANDESYSYTLYGQSQIKGTFTLWVGGVMQQEEKDVSVHVQYWENHWRTCTGGPGQNGMTRSARFSTGISGEADSASGAFWEYGGLNFHSLNWGVNLPRLSADDPRREATWLEMYLEAGTFIPDGGSLGMYDYWVRELGVNGALGQASTGSHAIGPPLLDNVNERMPQGTQDQAPMTKDEVVDAVVGGAFPLLGYGMVMAKFSGQTTSWAKVQYLEQQAPTSCHGSGA